MAWFDWRGHSGNQKAMNQYAKASNARREFFSRSTRGTSPFIFLFLILSVTSRFPMQAQEITQHASSTNDLIAFFKDAICLPPDVDHFSARQRVLRIETSPSSGGLFSWSGSASELPPPVIYDGKWSKGKFVLFCITTNSQSGGMTTNIIGRSSDYSYQINENTLVRSADTESPNSTNMAVRLSDASFDTIKQFFNMGIGDLELGSVVWKGNEFEAKRSKGLRFFGQLATTNGLPYELNLSKERGGKPYKKCSYEYSKPPGSLGGFPLRTIISTMSPDGLSPFLELTILDFKAAKTPIPNEDFIPNGFVTTNTRFTVIYSNGSRYMLDTNGQMIKSEAQAANRNKVVFPRIVIACFGLVTVVGILFARKISAQNK